MPTNLENSAVATGHEKVRFHSNLLRKAKPKNVQTTTQLHSSHMLAQHFPSQASTEREPRTSRCSTWIEKRQRNQRLNWIIEKAREFQKNIYYCFIDYIKAFVWITTNCGTFLKIWANQSTWPDCWEIFMQVRKQQLELDLEQQTGSKLGKVYVKAVYCHPAYLTSMQSTSCKMPGWMKHKL